MTTKKTTPKADQLKALKLSKAAKQALMKNDTTEAPEAASSPKSKKQATAPAELSAVEKAGNAFYETVTVKKFKSARREVAVPAFVGGVNWMRFDGLTGKLETALINLVKAVETGGSYEPPMQAAKKLLKEINL